MFPIEVKYRNQVCSFEQKVVTQPQVWLELNFLALVTQFSLLETLKNTNESQ